MKKLRNTASGYSKLYQRVWRWHFFAGIVVLPFAIVLALSGSIYLFKSQIEGYKENQINQLALVKSGTPLAADTLVNNLLAQYPESKLRSYTLAKAEDLSVEIELIKQNEKTIFWLNQFDGKVLAQQNTEQQLLTWVKHLHGELLAGNAGSYVVEFMASWMIVLIVSGLYLWWPKNRELSVLGNLRIALFPRFCGLSAKQKWRSAHGVVGFWISLLVLTLLLSGLPWTQLWGAGFDKVQVWLKVVKIGQEFNVTLQSSAPKLIDEHQEHQDHDNLHEHREHHKQQQPAEHALQKTQTHDDGIALWQKTSADTSTHLQSSVPLPQHARVSLQQVIELAAAYEITAPVIIQPPKPNNGVWTVRGMSQDRVQRQTVHFDQWTAKPLMHIRFSDYPAIKRLTAYGIALHEGALFGWLNQLLGLLTALAIVFISVSGAIMWWQRRPVGKLAAPKKPLNQRISFGLGALIIALALFLPMVALSLLVIGVFELVVCWINKIMQR